jgi:hypothetical protein
MISKIFKLLRSAESFVADGIISVIDKTFPYDGDGHDDDSRLYADRLNEEAWFNKMTQENCDNIQRWNGQAFARAFLKAYGLHQGRDMNFSQWEVKHWYRLLWELYYIERRWQTVPKKLVIEGETYTKEEIRATLKAFRIP